MSQQYKAGWKWEDSINPKTPTPHNQSVKNEKYKIVGDKKMSRLGQKEGNRSAQTCSTKYRQHEDRKLFEWKDTFSKNI